MKANMFSTNCLICFICLGILLFPAVAVDEDHAAWTCDDMTPNLCNNLKEERGTVTSKSGLQVHYWKYSPPKTDSDKYPLVVINGGPGLAHNYDLPLRQLACEGRDVYFYDQAGTGLSKLPANSTVVDDFPFLLDVAYYSQKELPTLIETLQLDRFHIVADSWGTMIAMQYSAMQEHGVRNTGLLSMSLNGPIPRAKDYVDKAWDPNVGSIGTLPAYIQSRLHKLNQYQAFDSEEFKELFNTVTSNFYTRNGKIADCAMDSLGYENEEIFVGMWGAVDFFPLTGTLQDFDMFPYLKHNLADIPTLLTCGEFDVVRPITIQAMQSILLLSESHVLKGSGHLSIFDVPGVLLSTIQDFVTRVEASVKNGESVLLPDPQQSLDHKLKTPARQMFTTVAFGFITVVASLVVGFWVGKREGRRSQYNQVDLSV